VAGRRVAADLVALLAALMPANGGGGV